MARHIMFCKTCNQYTMQEKCPKCGVETNLPRPAKYSPDDPYAKYRRKAKVEQNLLS